ncbi:GIY-YIG nuclease family protein [Desulforhopalus vacuolatus]|uniref:GIY-YIG nuclease family protein n=1 Tax=Desulforhopalus vacuolatus TaxID=40414 RepID=UPI0019664F20|nr:GIY-YIG nuclease family protein [Desulforhopalus vacuolatus]MBM9520696.1 GIY-YIG nuclease family protein [Desulforhopalus vacuolatus]
MKTTQDWHVYILRCADETFYTGITTDPARRLHEHNGERRGGARYTRTRRPVEMIWCEMAEDRAAASRREWEIKHLTRVQKKSLISRYKGRELISLYFHGK